jgi:small-conductance mechanosensitive channel
MKEFLSTAHHAASTELFRIGNTPISVSTLASVLLVLIATFWISRAARKLVERAMASRGSRPGVIGGINRLIHYTIIVAGIGVALGTAGINVSALFTTGALFAVGLGFAMQNIAQNFVAGIVLHTERTIRPGDVLEVGDRIVRITDIGIRASVAQTRDGEDIVLPNSMLVQEAVKNYTLRNAQVRIRVPVGVSYGSDMNLVKTTLTEVAHAVGETWAVENSKPLVVMTGFGNNSVMWEVGIWMDDPWEWRPAISALHEAIWWAFKEKGIIIAFPQLDIHLDAPVVESFERLSSRS